MDLIVQHVSKAYGTQRALSRVSLTAGVGVTAVLGPNGSGKSTLLRLLATLDVPDRGIIFFGGHMYGEHHRALRSAIGYLPQQLDLPERMTARSFLRYTAQLKYVHDRRQIDAVIDALALDSLADRRLATLSNGQQRLVGLAQALIHAPGQHPHLLLLDEPLAGLDHEERKRALRAVAYAATHMVVVLTSHTPDVVVPLTQQVVVLRQGVLLFAGNVAALQQHVAGHVHEMLVPSTSVEQWLSRAIVSRVTSHGDYALVRVVGTVPSGAAAKPVAGSLEEAYLWMQMTAAQHPDNMMLS